MGKEIERKFLVRGDGWRALAQPVRCRQGYLSIVPERTVRVRAMGGKGYLTIKGVMTGVTRAEYEYEIPAADAERMLTDLCEKPLIEKSRSRISLGGIDWEVDEFSGDNRGLVLAEVELVSADQVIAKPAWVGAEVSGDPRYFNSNLSQKPFTRW